MKSAILCNSLMGLPAVYRAAQFGRVAALGLPEGDHEALDRLTQLAQGFGIPVRRFTRKDLGTQMSAWVRQCAAHSLVCLTFPWKIPQQVLDAVPGGGWNFHFALLPEFRGPDGIFWTIALREPYGGITVHRMTAALDEGEILFRERVPLQASHSHALHSMQLAQAGSALMDRFLAWQGGGALLDILQPQDPALARYYPRPGAQDLMLQWSRYSGPELQARIKAANSWNRGAFTSLQGMMMRIVDGECVPMNHTAVPGTVLACNPQQGLLIATRDGALRADILYTDAGYFTGPQMSALGVAPGVRFVDIA